MQTLLWRAERHPVQSSTTTVVIDLDRAPDWKRFVAATEWGTGLVRRLRQRVVDPVVPTAPPTWADDPTFDLAYHLRRERADSREEMLAAAAQVALRPFDRSRPLWEGVLFEMPDSAAYVLKIHHALADPLGTVQLLSMLQSGRRAHTPRKPLGDDAALPVAPTGRPRGRGSAHRRLDAARRRAGGRAHPRPRRRPPAGGRRVRVALRRVRASAAHPDRAALARAGHRAPARCGRSSPSRPRSSRCARSRDRAAAPSTTSAVALVLGGLRRYHARRDSPVRELPVGVRVSLDRADDLGNRFAGALISGPLAIEDPVDRVAAVRGEVLSLHTERALEVLDATAPVLNRMPSFVGASALRAAVPAGRLRADAARAAAPALHGRCRRCRGCTSSGRCPAPR